MTEYQKSRLISQAILQALHGYAPVAVDELHRELLLDIHELHDTATVTITHGQLQMVVTAVVTVTAPAEPA